LIILILVLGIPISINEAYINNNGCTTLWGASEVIAFYSVFLSGVITFGALAITIFYNKKSIEKQLKLNMAQTKQLLNNISSNPHCDL
jgi:large-conductance mechanosensitive channel